MKNQSPILLDTAVSVKGIDRCRKKQSDWEVKEYECRKELWGVLYKNIYKTIKNKTHKKFFKLISAQQFWSDVPDPNLLLDIVQHVERKDGKIYFPDLNMATEIKAMKAAGFSLAPSKLKKLAEEISTESNGLIKMSFKEIKKWTFETMAEFKIQILLD